MSCLEERFELFWPIQIEACDESEELEMVHEDSNEDREQALLLGCALDRASHKENDTSKHQ